ncbi:cell division protein FtsA [Patescibacteria group bacterium]|nr:cell division protein FtsA [Patescibacteria group bacterium]MBU1921960.1 cell division protein FtsA [Patescibacteria group bacterium]
MSDEITTGLDIGSSHVRIAVGQFIPSAEKKEVHIIGAVEVPAEGISKGAITSIEDAVSSVSAALEQAERITGVPINSAWVGISGSHVIAQESKGVVGVSRSDGEIKEEDVERAIEAARTVATPSNYEILHVLPKSFTIDGQGGIKDPVGMTGIRLEVDAEIIQGLSSQIKNITKCVYRTGLDINDLVLSALAGAETVLSGRQKELGVAMVNIGATTTSLIVFEEGDVLHTVVIPIGGDHITSDIAIGLRTSIDIAEAIKIEQGTAVTTGLAKRDQINLAEFGADEEEMVSLKYIAEIIEARVEEIMEKVDSELKKIDRSGMLPAGVVLTGGAAKLKGMIDVCKKKLRLPASLGYPMGVTSVTDKTQDLAFSTAVGLVMWGSEITGQKGQPLGKFFGKYKSVGKAATQVKKWFKSLIP